MWFSVQKVYSYPRRVASTSRQTAPRALLHVFPQEYCLYLLRLSCQHTTAKRPGDRAKINWQKEYMDLLHNKAP
jgi:hypothetical protein